jgi:hypothetical protein
MAQSRKCLFYGHFNSHHEVLTHNLGLTDGVRSRAPDGKGRPAAGSRSAGRNPCTAGQAPKQSNKYLKIIVFDLASWLRAADMRRARLRGAGGRGRVSSTSICPGRGEGKEEKMCWARGRDLV